MQPVMEQKIQEDKLKNKNTEENFEYSVNSKIEIDRELFNQKLGLYIEKLKERNSMNLASALQNAEVHFNHNKLVLLLENEILKQLAEREMNLLPFLREQLNTPELFWELGVSEKPQSSGNAIPYTNEEKLTEMSKKNPNLTKLQEIFKTRIIYD